jgi:prevent-host-death family protein
MSVKVSLHQLRDRLSELLNRLDQTGEEFVVQRNGKDYAVVVSPQQWRRRTAGRRLDALGPNYRLSPAKQARMEELLAAKKKRPLSPHESRRLRALLRECDSILVERAAALDRLS